MTQIVGFSVHKPINRDVRGDMQDTLKPPSKQAEGTGGGTTKDISVGDRESNN